jgi:L-ascorbate metabolism protein UlaG (beta-lactamase superfamily)
MADTIRITYLDHSGFIVETARYTLVFDYYRDPAQVANFTPDKPLYFFASHAHGDHFNPAIAAWQEQTAAYILNSDIRSAGGLPTVKQAKTHYLSPYEAMTHKDLRITAYGSTDEGGSFLVEVDGWRLFHAGDLNWWHWKEDTPENIAQAKTDFFRELHYLNGQQLDVAFFPVDSRLEEYRDLGVRELVKTTQINHLITMHDCGKSWTPPVDFAGYKKSLWVPTKPGEALQLEK